MDHSHLRRFHLLDQARDDQVLTTTFWAAEHKVLISLKQWLNHGNIFLERRSQDHWWGLRVGKVFELKSGRLLDEGAP